MKFLVSEYVTGKVHGGRIDTLGIDENRCPVIIEYKRALNENVISQGLFYLDWLLDHKAEFTLMVLTERNGGRGDEGHGQGHVCRSGDRRRGPHSYGARGSTDSAPALRLVRAAARRRGRRDLGHLRSVLRARDGQPIRTEPRRRR